MTEITNLVVVSDLHCGCRVALCPPDGFPMDDGGRYMPSQLQLELWSHWREFWGEWVPSIVHDEPFGVAINGDAVEGVHHKSVTQISQNPSDQAEYGYRVIAPVVDQCGGRFWMIRGTEAHVGPSGCEEEKLAERLGALPDSAGKHARWELWKRVGPSLVHALHHIGTTGTQAYETTAIHKEMTEAYGESGRWGEEPPDFIVRSHRHRYVETIFATRKGRAHAVVTPGWQAKTPFAFRIPGGRQALPQFGGIIVRHHARDGVSYVASRVWTPRRAEAE